MKSKRSVLLGACLITACLFFTAVSIAELAAPHNAANNIGCSNYCHILPTVKSPYWDHAPADIDDTPTNHLCNSCHTANSGPFSMVNAPAVKTHSSLTTDTDYGNWTIGCTDCHSPHFQEQLQWAEVGETGVFLATGRITNFLYDGVGETLLTLVPGTLQYKDGWNAARLAEKTAQYRRTVLLPDRLFRETDQSGSLSFQVVAVDDIANTITVKGDVTPVYARSPLPSEFGIIFGQLVRQSVTKNGFTIPVKFFDNTAAGNGGFTDQTSTVFPKGICQVCHTQTSHWSPAALAAGDVHYPDRSCTECHTHQSGFAHGGTGGGTGCEPCHGHDAGYEYSPGLFSQGRGSTWSHSTHTENDVDDLKGPALACAACHNTTNFPYFASGVDGDGDGKFSLSETDVCDTCHSPLGTYNGVSDATVGAKNLWTTGAYDHAGGNPHTLLAGKEKWCATCHDEVASVVSGITAPNVVGDESGAYAYGTGWGYYKTGHGLPVATTYAASGGLTYGAGKECANCHDYSNAHVDGNARTYSSGSSNYQTGYRLKSVSGAESMSIPRPDQLPLNSDDFRLCFSCHDENKYLLETPNPVTTSFRDDTNVGSGWNSGKSVPVNLHEYHLDFVNLNFDSDWTGGGDSRITCVTCHNVHGSSQHSMVRDGSLINKAAGLVVWYGNATTTYNPPWPNDPPANYVLLSASDRTVWSGTSASNICTACHGGNYAKYDRSPPTAPAAPSLDWTGEAGYISDGANPDGGSGGTYFTFRIKYTDANAQTPRAIQVWVDEDDSGTYETGEQYDMVAVDNDLDVTDGKLYRRIVAVGSAGDGTLSYRFYASDGKFDAIDGTASGDPTDPAANTITVTNNAPTLSYTGETGYSGDGVSPDSGAGGSTFTFRASYADSDNNAPTAIEVWVDTDDSATYEPGEKYALTAVDGGDATYTDGKLYSRSLVIAAAGDGTLNYRFHASDGTDNATGAAISDKTFTVTSANSAPTLWWTGETGYVRDGANPDSGTADSSFTFRVSFGDADNDTPSSIQLWLDRNDDEDYDDANEKIDLTAVDGGDSDTSDGKLYTLTTAIAAAGDGVLNYRFYASDGTASATGAPTADSMVTILINAIKVSCQAIGDYDYTTIQTAINNAVNGDTILVADGTCSETIAINNKDLTITSVNGAAATILNAGDAGTAVTLTNGADTTFNGLTIRDGNNGSYGGGFHISNSSPVITNSIVTSNTAGRAGGVYVSTSGSTVTISDTTLSGNTSSFNGGAVYLESGASAVITNSTFHDNAVSGGNGAGVYMTSSADAALTVSGSTFTKNTATYGGAIYANTTGGNVSITVADSTFTASDTTDAGTIAATRNSAGNRGGIMYLTDGGGTFNLTITDSTLQYGNSTFEGGALYLANLDATTISGSTFANNTSGSAGALLYSNGAGNSITITDSIIRDNSTTANHGGFYMAGGTITLDRCTITGNTAASRGGGGTFSSVAATAGTTIQNTFVTGNKATGFEGGGFWIDQNTNAHTVNITNSTFAGNSANAQGGGLHTTGAPAITVKNSIFWRNGGVGGGTSAKHEINGTVTASYSDIRQSGFTGNNNINIDPLFVSPVSYTSAPTSSGNYHLQLNSPAVDMGTAAGAPGLDIDNNIRPLGAGVDMGADEVVSVTNYAPALTWTGETGYSADGVNSDTGSSGASFEFRVTYVDADNNPPGAIQVWVDENDNGLFDAGEKYAMTAADGDAVYSDGKIYTKTLALNHSGDGALSYRFYANDSISTATGPATSTGNVVINNPPALSWVGSGNFTADGADPDSGPTGNFEFRITYTDANNDPPTAIQVWIDRNDDGDYLDAGERITLAALDTNDTVFTDGKNYSKTVQLTPAGDTVLNYRFYASDGAPATGTPATTDKTVTVTNNPPSLAWVGSGAYTPDGVDPNNAVGGASYTFRVSYTDSDNQAPTTIEVWVDENDNATYEPGEKYAMTGLDGGDLVYSDGKVYTKTMTLNWAGAGDGYLNYRFYASDGAAAASGAPAGDSQVGVFQTNNAPDLDWTGENGYTIDGVSPDTGPEYYTLTFRMKYTDIENTAPSSAPQLWIDLNNDTDYTGEEGTELFAMNEVDATDTDYTNGKLYTLGKSVVTPGTYRYAFVASDGTDSAVGNAAYPNFKTVTISTAITACASGCDFAKIQWAIDDAGTLDGSFIRASDATYAENINFSGKNITIYAQNPGASTITGTGIQATPVENTAVVRFTSGENNGAVLQGFVIDNANNGDYARGIYVLNSSPTIRSSTITGNKYNQGDGGGGIYINNGSPVIEECTITSNAATNRSGGAIYIKGAAGGATITGTTIGGGSGTKNTASNGAGIYFVGPTTGSLTITNSEISYNEAPNYGGIYLSNIANETVVSGSTIDWNYGSNNHGGAFYVSESRLRISNSSVDNNRSGTSRSGSAIYMTGATSSLVIENNSTFNNNGQSSTGGALYLTGSTAAVPLSVSDTVFDNNDAADGGGAIYMNALTNSSSFINVTITNNANNANGYGGGIYAINSPFTMDDSTVSSNTVSVNRAGGGIYLQGTTATVTNTTFRSNSGGAGGAIGINNTSVLNLIRATVLGNSSTATGGGGGIQNAGGTATIINSLIAGNTASSGITNGGGGIFNSGTLKLYYSTIADNHAGRYGSGLQANGTETVRNSIIWGNAGGSGETNGTVETLYLTETAVDPKFVLRDTAGSGSPTTGGNYRLQADSNCIDTGDATVDAPDVTPLVDLDNNSRPYDMPAPAGDGVDDYDKGAYEYRP